MMLTALWLSYTAVFLCSSVALTVKTPNSQSAAAAPLFNAVQSRYSNTSNTDQMRSMVAMQFVFSLFYMLPGAIGWV